MDARKRYRHNQTFQSLLLTVYLLMFMFVAILIKSIADDFLLFALEWHAYLVSSFISGRVEDLKGSDEILLLVLIQSVGKVSYLWYLPRYGIRIGMINIALILFFNIASIEPRERFTVRVARFKYEFSLSLRCVEHGCIVFAKRNRKSSLHANESTSSRVIRNSR